MPIVELTAHEIDQINQDGALNQQVQLGTKLAEIQAGILGYVTTTEESTLTLKTLTTPIIASIYQDAEKTKLMTVPDTASDTLAALAATQTLTNKTLTTPIIASIYQDAEKTKLMTVPDVASDTLAVIGAEQTLALKTLTTPVIVSLYQDAEKTKLMTVPDTASDTLAAIAATQTLTNKTLTSPAITQKTVSHDYDGAAVEWTLSAAERGAQIIRVTNANGGVDAIFNVDTPNFYLIDNQSGQALTCKNVAGTAIVVASTKRAIVWNDGTNIVRITEDA